MLPAIPSEENRIDPQITAFTGLYRRSDPKDGAVTESQNLSARHAPFLSPRRPRLLYQELLDPTAMWIGDSVVLVNGSDLLLDGRVAGTVTRGAKQFAALNNKLVIWPDKKYLDLSTGALYELGATVCTTEAANTVFTTASVTVVPNATATGVSFHANQYSGYGGTTAYFSSYLQYVMTYTSVSFSGGVWTMTGAAEKRLDNLVSGDIFMILDGTESSMNRRVHFLSRRGSTVTDDTDEVVYGLNDHTGLYGVVERVVRDSDYGEDDRLDVTVYYSVLTATNTTTVEKKFRAGDAVTVRKGDTVYCDHAIVRSVSVNTLTFDDGTFEAGTVTGKVEIVRDIPDIDFICSAENRLWGVSNRTENLVYNAETGAYETVRSRVIWASALGDPTNFYVYDGLSTDSYAVAVAGSGDFSGCVGYSGSVIFFKERKLYRLSGDYPSNYTLYSYDATGCETGSILSCVCINDVLYYLAEDGVYAFAGSAPELVSFALGDGPFYDGVAGTDGVRYFLSCRDCADVWSLYVYDTKSGLWYREDDTHAVGFGEYEDAMYMTARGEDGGAVWLLDTESATYTRYDTAFMAYAVFLFLPRRLMSYKGAVSSGSTYHFSHGDTSYQFTASLPYAWDLSTDVLMAFESSGVMTVFPVRDGEVMTDDQSEPVVFIAVQGSSGEAIDMPEVDVMYGFKLNGARYGFYMPPNAEAWLLDRVALSYDKRYPYEVRFLTESGESVYSSCIPVHFGRYDIVVIDDSGFQPHSYTETAEPVEWSFTLAPADETNRISGHMAMFNRKNYRWLRLRMRVPQGSTVHVATSFDGEPYVERWHFTAASDFAGTVNIPLPPNRTDVITVKLWGEGDMTLQAVCRAYNVGSVKTR